METLKAAIPESLKRAIGDSNADDLQSTCSSLHRFFLHFDPFHQIIAQLANPKYGLCGKNKEDALKSKQLGNECFSNADYAKALECYTQALRKAPLDTGDMKSNLVATLYINRATVLHKMSLLVECLRDCTRALQIFPSYSKAWYRRGKANASLGNYRNAICDLNVAKIVEPSMGGKRQIEGELKILLDQCKSTSAIVQIQRKENNCNTVGEMPQIKLQCISIPDKGRGMVSSCVISPGSLVHSEEPYAMIILKQCRETHCHYCLNDLPADRVPCLSCSIPLYCSYQCQIRAGGQMFRIYPEENVTFKKMPSDLGEYASEVIQSNDSEQEIEDITEHKHECRGVHWPVVLPSEIVLAGRILARFLLNSTSDNIINFVERLELSHRYKHMSSESKLDSHIYAIVLLYCLQHSCGTMFSIDGVSISQVVIIISQIKVNCMTIVRLKSIDAPGLSGHFGEFPFKSDAHSTSNVEQVRVGKAIYKAASLFNHSCRPNAHAYFLSRTLYLRTTHGVTAGCQLELSYGPQVGLWDCKDRLNFLKDEYAFHCQCIGCSVVNVSDIVLNAFHCVNQNCSGAVLESRVIDCEQQKIKHFTITDRVEKNDDICEVCLNVFKQNGAHIHGQPGYCLKCGSYCDLESSHAAVNEAVICIKRLQDAISSKEISSITISDALISLQSLRLNLHAYNKLIAEAEDSIAQAFCLVGELQLSVDHCKASIQILEKLYDTDDIVIAYELVKLSSIQLSLDDSTAMESINRIDDIFSRYYGTHADLVFPYLQYLRSEIKKFSVKAIQ
ncbi:SET and MYND domain-containing protein 4 [Vigna unguiculata]|uniref:Tetratricopeptide repeat n=1 Tax=Vigna unguiculata TaxID=3917 RepID=A0A4D6NNI5_VIGUN|nr:SET and MYND domain-containing protein 4 [Vigna unguiculata]QCE15420.1 Tetratricopeptide repeat [Vigna unguiculata]